ncbi:MAG: DUF423 domain-containing protein, partial [Pseudomonadota bacterium]
RHNRRFAPDIARMNNPSRRFLSAGAVSALVAVVLGAFGAHALEDRLTADMLAVIEVIRIGRLVHRQHISLALLAVGFLAQSSGGKWVSASGWCFIAGLLIFSGSLYVLALSGIRILGALTPIGGVFFIIGWAFFVVAAYAAAGPRSND